MEWDSRRPSTWFILAWVLLVVTISFALWRQSVLIDEVEQQGDFLEQLVVTGRERQMADIQALCTVLLDIADPATDDEVMRAFRHQGYACPRPEGG